MKMDLFIINNFSLRFSKRLIPYNIRENLNNHRNSATILLGRQEINNLETDELKKLMQSLINK